MPDFGSLTSIAAIIAASLALVQIIKDWPILETLPTKAIALVIGAALTAFAFYSGQVSGNLGWIIVQVILGIVGAPAFFELVKTPATK